MNFRFPIIKVVFGFVLVLIFSWLLFHFTAFLGIFLALAYPIWWLIAPQTTICVICKSRKQDEICPLCHEPVNKQSSQAPKNLRSVLLNSILILFFTLVSIILVYFEFYILSNSGLIPPEKTVSFLIPTKSTYEIGRTFEIKVELTGIETNINTVQADFSFDPDMLELIEISTQDSFATIFIQKDINNEVGFGRITGGLPNPGYDLPNGLFATLYFRGKLTGPTEIEFLPTSLVLANDGRGSNVIKDFANVPILLLPVGQSDDNSNNADESLVKGTSDSNQLILYNQDQQSPGSKNTTNPEPIPEITPNSIQKVLMVLHEIDEKIFNFYSEAIKSLRDI